MSHVVCLLNVEADRGTFTWSEGPAAFEPYALDGLVYREFKELASAVREKLANLIKDYFHGEDDVAQAAYELAAAGYELYEALFDPGADQRRQARQVRKWLEQLARERAVDTLEMVVESPWSLPWNVIYDREPDERAFLSGDNSPDRWRPFWGLRYNLCGGRKVNPLRRMPILTDPKVLMVVDPEIRDGLPEEQQRRLAEFCQQHGLDVVHTKDELKRATQAERPDLLYWMSHAEPDALILSHEPVSPRNLRRLLKQDDDEDLTFGGLAFLNACQTAESAGEEGSFFEAFHSVGFAGMIGTEHQTVDLFANPLGLDFLEAFLDRGEPVGSVLRQLRGRVPLGLLYGTYCPPDIRVEKGSPRDSVTISQLEHMEGTVLTLAGAADAPPRPPLPDEPYRSLAYYDRQDRALFAGREDDVERFATYLDDVSTRILVLHGESGVGKSSFLRAGVIPFLEEECVGYRFLRGRDGNSASEAGDSVIFVRATNDLFGQLARALCDFCARPYEYETPTGERVCADLPGLLRELVGSEVSHAVVRALLRSDPPLLGQILTAISDRLPFAAILVIDQCEEVFTLAQTPEDQQRGRRALDMLRRTVGATGDFKVILSLRTEYYGRLVDRLRRGLHDTGSIREYLLTDFDEPALLEAVQRPTASESIPYTSEIPFNKYGFRYADGVAQQIAHRVVRYTTQRRDSVLPLVQVICAQLYGLVRDREDKTITSDDLATLGGIEGGMRNHVEGLLRELVRAHPRDKKPVQKLFTQLYLQQPDGTLTTALLAKDELRRRWTGRMSFDDLLTFARAMRLLKVNSLRIGFEEERRYVSLGHDALAKLAADWDEQLSRGARLRKMAAVVAGISAVAIVMGVLAVRATLAKNEAQRNLFLAKTAVDEMLTEVGDESLKEIPQMEDIRRELLDKALVLYQRLEGQRPDAGAIPDRPAGDLRTDLRIELRMETATAQRRLADIYCERGEEGDKQKAEGAYDRAIAELQRLVDRFPDEPEFQYRLAYTHDCKGELLRPYAKVGDESSGRSKDAMSDYNKALAAYDDALRIQGALIKRFERDEWSWLDADYLRRSRQQLARTTYNRGILIAHYGDKQQAERAYRNAIDMLTRLTEDKDAKDIREYWFELARSHNLLANLLDTSKRREKARDLYQDAIDILEPLAGDGRAYKLELALTATNYADLLWRDDDFEAADQASRRALELYDELAAGTAAFQNLHANSYNTRGNLLGNTDPDAAREAFEQAKTIFERLVKQHDDIPDYKHRLGNAFGNLGWRCKEAEQYDKAVDYLSQAAEYHRVALKEKPGNTGYRNNLRGVYDMSADCQLRLNDTAEAAKTAQRLSDEFPHEWRGPWQAAQIMARCAAAVKVDDPQCQAYVRRAVGFLKMAVDENVDHGRVLEAKDDLQPLFGNDEFDTLWDQLETERNNRQ